VNDGEIRKAAAGHVVQQEISAVNDQLVRTRDTPWPADFRVGMQVLGGTLELLV
jgi:hypothetical protein